jgi:hypothetical protein
VRDEFINTEKFSKYINKDKYQHMHYVLAKTNGINGQFKENDGVTYNFYKEHNLNDSKSLVGMIIKINMMMSVSFRYDYLTRIEENYIHKGNCLINTQNLKKKLDEEKFAKFIMSNVKNPEN